MPSNPRFEPTPRQPPPVRPRLKRTTLSGVKKRSVMPELSDKWAAGEIYEDFMGRWSRLVAPRFVSWLPVRPNANWLDVGCGTSALGVPEVLLGFRRSRGP